MPPTSTKFRKSKLLRATTSGSVSLTLSVNENLTLSQSLTKMAQDLPFLTEGQPLTTTGGRRSSATRTLWWFCSKLTQVAPARVGGLTGVSTKFWLLFHIIHWFFNRNSWRWREQANKWSSEVAQLPGALSKQSWLDPDRRSCRGQIHPFWVHKLQHWTRIWLGSGCGPIWDPSYAVRRGWEDMGQQYTSPLPWYQEQVEHHPRQLPHWRLRAEVWLENGVDWDWWVNTGTEV